MAKDDDWWEDPEEEEPEEEIDLAPTEDEYFSDDFGEEGAYGERDE